MRKACAVALFIFLLAALCACAGGGISEPPDLSHNAPEQPAPPAAQTSPPAGSAATSSPQATDQIPEDEPEPEPPPTVSGEVIISFDFVRQSGSASNQFAVWIEDMSGNLIKTLYASRWTANGGYKSRPDSIKMWVGRSGLANKSSAEVDAFSGATPGTGPVSFTWDLTRADGTKVPPGEYMFYVEGTLRWKNYVIYSGVITLGDEPERVFGDDFFHYEASDRYGALNHDSGENSMVGLVTARFIPFEDD